jgi:hypothetical protein
MQRRDFLLSGTASAVLALGACGGGGSIARDAPAVGAGASPDTGASADAGTSPDTGTSFDTAAASPPADVPPARPLGYPFGARLQKYVAGIQPSATAAEMDAHLKAHYDAWKAARLVSAEAIVAGGYAVKFAGSAYLTVSEAMGYGMLLAVLFAGHDPQARAIFDGLLAVVRARPAYAVAARDPNGSALMDWRLSASGASAGEGWNAMDGDEDIAMALLMADRQWGSSSGRWNYLEEARRTIAALKSWNMAADGTTKGMAKADCSRTSDYMFGHFRAFAAATQDRFWLLAIDRAWALLDRMQTVYAAGTGLVPDFIAFTNTPAPAPSPDFYTQRQVNEGAYLWNACRCPWRWATDYLLSGDPRAKTVTTRLLDFFSPKVQAGGIFAIDCGYRLDGTVLAGGDSAAFISPIMLGGCVDAKYQALVDAGWAWGKSRMVTGYYDGEIQLLSSVVAAGNWWSPA